MMFESKKDGIEVSSVMPSCIFSAALINQLEL